MRHNGVKYNSVVKYPSILPFKYTIRIATHYYRNRCCDIFDRKSLVMAASLLKLTFWMFRNLLYYVRMYFEISFVLRPLWRRTEYCLAVNATVLGSIPIRSNTFVLFIRPSKKIDRSVDFRRSNSNVTKKVENEVSQH